MPIYHHLGNLPHKRHTVFRRGDGSLHAEELIGNKGFTGPSSLLYHLHQPTPVRAVKPLRDLQWHRDPERQFRHRHFRTHQLGPGGSLALDRCTRVRAWLDGSAFVTPDHVRAVMHECLRHRLILSYEALSQGITADQVIDKIAALVAAA